MHIPTFSPTFLLTIHDPAQQQIQYSLMQTAIIISICYYYYYYYYYYY